MKKTKIFFFSVLLLAINIVFITNVKAASIPYTWYANGLDVSSFDVGGVTIEKGEDSITLILNNYNGGVLEEKCYGTEQENILFNIVLIGENYINSDNYGIILEYPNGKINFSGEGSLIINANTPINYETYSNYMYINPSQNIYTNEKIDSSSNETSISDNNNNISKTTEKKSSKTENKELNTNLIVIILLLYIVISNTVFIILLQKKNKA